MGRFEPARAQRTGHSRSEVAHCYDAGQLPHALPTLMAVPAAGLDVGLMALTERTPGDGHRPQPLRSCVPAFQTSNGISHRTLTTCPHDLGVGYPTDSASRTNVVFQTHNVS